MFIILLSLSNSYISWIIIYNNQSLFILIIYYI